MAFQTNPSLSPQYDDEDYATALGPGYDPLSSVSSGSSSSSAAPSPADAARAASGDQSYAAALAQAAGVPQTASQGLAASAGKKRASPAQGSRAASGTQGYRPQAEVPQNMAAYTDAYSNEGRTLDPQKGVAIQSTASRLGIAPSDLAAIIEYETAGSFSPDQWGGAGGKYMGLIQFGPSERKKYGIREGMTFEEQMEGPVYNYLKDRGVKPGHSLAHVYTAINYGNVHSGKVNWGARDKNGTIRQHVDDMTRYRLPKYTYLNGGDAPRAAQDATLVAGTSPPNPRMRPQRGNPAMPGTMTAGGQLPPRPNANPRRQSVMAYGEEAATEAPFDAVMSVPNPRPRPQRAAPAPTAVPSEPSPQAAAPMTYVVSRGESLSQIAQRAYGDPNRWREIAAANQLRNPNRIQPGQRLVIPGAEAASPPNPRPRPERGVGIPNPRPRPSREAAQPQMAEWSEGDEMTEVDENGNYINPPMSDEELLRLSDQSLDRAQRMLNPDPSVAAADQSLARAREMLETGNAARANMPRQVAPQPSPAELQRMQEQMSRLRGAGGTGAMGGGAGQDRFVGSNLNRRPDFVSRTGVRVWFR